MTEPTLDSVDAAIIGERLAAARKARGLTQQRAAEELDLARTTVVAMEKEERRPKVTEFIQFASLYGRQVSDFFRPSPVREPHSFIVQFRAARAPADSPMNDLREGDIQRFKTHCERYLELETLNASPLPRRYPEPYSIEGVGPERAGEAIASAERNRLGLGDGPIGIFWHTLEANIGLRVFAFPFAESR
jgi:transcriptional regulator with XRE-family HTH domain